MDKKIRISFSKDFIDGYTSISLKPSYSWPDLSNGDERDLKALRSDWDNVGQAIKRETRQFANCK